MILIELFVLGRHQTLTEKFLAAAGNGKSLEELQEYAEIVDVRVKKDAALRIAALCGSLEKVQFLLAKGANVNAKNGNALENAVKACNFKIVEMLLAAGSILSDNVVLYAVQSYSFQITKLLIERGAPILWDKIMFDIMLRRDTETLEYFTQMGESKILTPKNLILSLGWRERVSTRFLMEHGVRLPSESHTHGIVTK